MVRKQIATRHTHDVFCKTVIGHAAIDAARSIRCRRPFESRLGIKNSVSRMGYTRNKTFPFHPRPYGARLE